MCFRGCYLKLGLWHWLLLTLLKVFLTWAVKFDDLLSGTFGQVENVLLAFIGAYFEATVFHSFSANGFVLLTLLSLFNVLLCFRIVTPLHALDLPGWARLFHKLHIASLLHRLEPILFSHDLNTRCSGSLYGINNFNFTIVLFDFDGFFEGILCLLLECGKLIGVVHWYLRQLSKWEQW